MLCRFKVAYVGGGRGDVVGPTAIVDCLFAAANDVDTGRSVRQRRVSTGWYVSGNVVAPSLERMADGGDRVRSTRYKPDCLSRVPGKEPKLEFQALPSMCLFLCAVLCVLEIARRSSTWI